MIGPDPSFVQRLRLRVRATPEARDRRRPRVRIPWYRRPLAWSALRFFVPAAVLLAGSTFADPIDLSRLLILWTTLVTLHRAQLVGNALHRPDDLAVFFQLPLSNLAVFRHQARLILRGSLWLGGDWLAFALVVAVHSGSGWAWLAAPLVAFAQWVVSLALAVLLVRWNPRFPYGSIAGVLWFVLWIGLQFAGKSTAAAALAQPFFHGIARFTPAGWIASAGDYAAHGALWAWCGLVVTGIGIWFFLRVGVAALRADFSLERLFGYVAGDATLQWTRAEPAATREDSRVSAEEPPPDPVPVVPVDLSVLREHLQNQLWQPAGLAFYHRGAIERFIARRLSARQCVIVDVLQPQGFGWSRLWFIALGCVLAARLLLVAGWDGIFPGVLAGGGVLVCATPLFGGTWAGFGAVEAYRASVSLHSLLPVGFWETARTRLVISTWRCVIALPLIYLASAMGVTSTPLPWTEALAWTLRVLVLLLAVQPFWVFLSVSKHTNDASSRWWLTLLMFLILLGGLAIFGVGFIAIAAEPGLFYQLVGAAALLVYAHGALGLYGWAYHHGLFDLIGKPADSRI